MLDTIYNDNPLVESSNNAQDTAQKDYADRFFYELFQNAKDVSGCTKIKIILQNGELLFCNNGSPISDSDFDSLCAHANSNKKDNAEQTGKYGIGKSSYYNISKNNHKIYSKAKENSQMFDGYCFELASDRIAEYKTVLEDLRFSSTVPFGDMSIIEQKGHTELYVQQIWEKDPDGAKRIQGLGHIRKNLAIPIESFPQNVKDLAADFSTVFYFTPDNLEDVESKLQEFHAEILKIFLFLPNRIREISIKHNETTTVFYRQIESEVSEYGEQRVCIGQRCNDETIEKRFFIWEKTASAEEMSRIYVWASGDIKRRDPLKVTIAVIPEDIDNEGYYFCDLPTEMTTGMNIYVDANFQLQSDRRSIRFNDPYNQRLLDFAAKGIKEIIQDILLANNGVPTLETMHLIAAMLQPGFSKSKKSEIYQAIKNIIDIAELPCVWGIKANKDLWCVPTEIYDSLSRKWSNVISKKDFYSKTDLAVLAEPAQELSKKFVIFFTEKDLPPIPIDIQRKILIELLQNNYKNHEKYLQIWQSILDNWSDLIDDEFHSSEIFLDDNGGLRTNVNLYFYEVSNKLLHPESIGPIQFPFKKLNKNLSAVIYQHKNEFSYFQDYDSRNEKWCQKIVSGMADASPELCETLFIILIEKFWDILIKDEDLLSKTLFPCNNNEWKFLKDISKGNGWGSKDNIILSFLNLCNAKNSITCLRAPAAKIWSCVSKEKIQFIADTKLNDISIFTEYNTEVIADKYDVRADDCSTLAREIIQRQFEYELGQSRYYPRYSAQANFDFFPDSLEEFSCEHAKYFWKFLLHNVEIVKKHASGRIHYKKIASIGQHSLYMPTPLRQFLMSYAWIPGPNDKAYKINDIVFLSKELRDKYPELIVLEKTINPEQISEAVRNFLIELGANQIDKESDIGYDKVFPLLKDNKQLNKFRKSFWDQLAVGEYQFVKLPSILPVIDSKGKSGFASLEDTKIYIADLSKRENKELQNSYHPSLDIDIGIFNNKMHSKNKESFILYSDLDRQIIIDEKNIEDCDNTPLIEYKNGLLAFSILLFFQNKKNILEKLRYMSLIEAESIVKKTGNVLQQIPHYFQNNIIVAGKEAWSWGVAKELKEWDWHIDNSPLEHILSNIDTMQLSDIIDLFENRKIDFDDNDIVEAKELLWGFDKAKALALRFIPEVQAQESAFLEYKSWEDVEAKSSLLDLELLKKFFTSTLPLAQRGKMLAKEYNIDLPDWNKACEELDEGIYENRQFSREFNKIRDEKFDLFMSCILAQTEWQAESHFLYDALQNWKNYDGGNNSQRFWFIDNDAFECIMNEFILQHYEVVQQNISGKEAYSIFNKNYNHWQTAGCNENIDIYSNEYFFEIYQQEYFEKQPEVLLPEEVVQENAIKDKVSQPVTDDVSVKKTVKFASQTPAVDSDSVRRNITSAAKQANYSKSSTQVTETKKDSSRSQQSKDLSDLENWENLTVEFTPYSGVDFSATDSRDDSEKAERNYSSASENEHLNDIDKEYIGREGEKCLFAYLQKQYSQVKWVSSNNTTGENPDDCLGYDFEITDGEQIKYVECKASKSTSGTAEIHLGNTELSKAQECLATKNYSVYRVFSTGEKLQIIDLGNPLAEGNTSISISGLKFRWRKK